MKIVTVVGARPQFVKASVVSRALLRHPPVSESIVHTGQHYDANMSDVFFQELEIPVPERSLGIGSGPHGLQTGRMLERLEAVFLEEPPDLVLVYGDTNSTLAGALAAAKLRIPIAHVEAGLRSFNSAMPEEINRVLTDHVSALLFAPTTAAVANLAREGIAPARVHQLGDVMLDAALTFGAASDRRSRVLAQLELRPGEFVLTTVHRAENTDDPAKLLGVFRGLQRISREMPVVLPLHPRTRALLDEQITALVDDSRIRIIDPVGYLDMLHLEKHARLILTDSGGVQKEAYFFSVPCITLRRETEWVELVEHGWNTLWSPAADIDSLVEIARRYMQSPPSEHPAIYGTGRAAEAIADVLASQMAPSEC
jgi:UDP-GlcNAc3NAcA epimerase